MGINIRAEIYLIKKWFTDNDYIELQAIRGTISRDSEKYQNYLKEYNEKLNRLRELEKEVSDNLKVL